MFTLGTCKIYVAAVNVNHSQQFIPYMKYGYIGPLFVYDECRTFCTSVLCLTSISALGIPLFITVSYFNYENVGLITVPRRVILYVIHRFLYPGIFSELTRINVISLISV